MPANNLNDLKHMQNQAIATRLAQITQPAGNANITSQMLQTLLNTSREGGNQAALQQMRQLLALQNQQRLGQKAFNPGLQDPVAAANDMSKQQLLMIAMQAQARQQQATGLNGAAGSVMPITNTTVPPPQPLSSLYQKIWSGEIVWTAKGGTNTSVPGEYRFGGKSA